MEDRAIIDGAGLSPALVLAVARGGVPLQVAGEVRAHVAASRAVVEGLIGRGEVCYGINTGFGSLARARIGDAQLGELQRNLVRSHAAGAGAPLPAEIVRATMVVLAASLCRGSSGVRPVVIETVVAVLNAGITPEVPEVGSVGASGDLAPLAHIALALMGEGRVIQEGTVRPAREALERAGIEPLVLEAKEGLALINGTHLMAARGALLCADMERLFEAAVVAAALSVDACRATDAPFDSAALEVRNQPGPRRVARALRALLRGSAILRSHREEDPRVQDPYSIRCLPQVLGAALDAYAYVAACVVRELGAVTDNPVVRPTGEVIAAGNFHGMPVALPLDVLAVALAHIAGVAERRVAVILEARDPESHLRPYLSADPGLQSGLMIAQYTAAACCNELQGLAAPASVHNLPTSAGVEDYNSFGPRSAAKARRALELSTTVVAIELLCAAEALEAHRPMKTGPALEEAHATIRERVPRRTTDRPPAPDIAALERAITLGLFPLPGEAGDLFKGDPS